MEWIDDSSGAGGKDQDIREVSVLDGVKEVFDRLRAKKIKCMHILIRIKKKHMHVQKK